MAKVVKVGHRLDVLGVWKWESPYLRKKFQKDLSSTLTGALAGPRVEKKGYEWEVETMYVLVTEWIVHRKKNWRWGMQVGWPGQRHLIAFGESILELLMGEKCKNRGKGGIKYQCVLHMNEPRKPHAVGSFPASSFSLQYGAEEKALALESHRPRSESRILFSSFGTLG